ncbi:MAG TPA: glutamate racemase [Armatimonadota bacterium]|mgnify:FL=1|nr:glutamate racemase [Armatimonadota bacterium]
MRNPIGMFDSGLGGLTVAGELLRQLPNESIIYFADTAHVPYGERPLAEIEEFALGITQFLIEQGAKAVVMACNMSSAAALSSARETFPDIPILGVIGPGSRAAVGSGAKSIGVLATTGTVKSGAYSRIIKELNPDCEVLEQPCPPFVPLVEAGLAESEEAEVAVRSCVEPLLANGIQAVVLGCTHYPFLRPAIGRTAPNVQIIDPAEETVRELHNILEERGITAHNDEAAEHIFYASGDMDGFARLGSSFLGKDINHVRHAQWGVDLMPRAKSRI